VTRTRRTPPRATRPRRGGPAAPPAAPAPPAEPSRGAERATLALWLALVALALARAALGFTPGMGAWSLNLHRFLHPALAWLPWAVAAAALVPAVARRIAPHGERIGEALASGARGPWIAALAAAAMALGLPDQARFTGDFLIRQGTIEEALLPERVWPQALPLDIALHFRLPLALSRGAGLDPNLYGRLSGAAMAAALALAAAWLARAAGFRRGAALVAWSGAFFVGTLALFTGYNKGLAGLAVLALAIGAAGVRVAREGRGHLALGALLALAVALHRSGPAFLAAGLVAWIAGGRARPGAWRERSALAAAALPLAALAGFGPKIVQTLGGYDRVHYAPADVAAAGGPLAAALAPARLADTANLVVLLAPLAVALPPVAIAFGRALPRRREGRVLAALAAPALAAFPLLRPINGPFRDWDVFAPFAAGLAALAAWLAGHALQRAPARAWVAPAAALALAVPALQWVAHQADLPRGIARAEAFAVESPARSGNERALTWDYVGTRWNQVQNYGPSAAAFRRATEYAPSPRLLFQWALSEVMAGNPRGAIVAYHRHLEKDPASLPGWLGLAAAASRVPDFEESRRALHKVLELDPGNRDALAILPQLEQSEAVWKAGNSKVVPYDLAFPQPPRAR
jgi:tetratricopeptide (TPR) repeat protein